MTTSPPNDGPITLSTAVAPVRARHHELIEEAVRWLAEHGHPVDPDHLALTCAGAETGGETGGDPDTHPTRWTRTAVYHVLRCDIPNWCAQRRCTWPVQLPQVPWAWFDFLHDTGRLDRRSDPVAELRKPLACYGGLDHDGNPLPPGAPRAIPCECLLPYRATTELLNELVRQSERVGEDPLDRLRWLVGRQPRGPLAAGRLSWLDDDPLDLDDW